MINSKDENIKILRQKRTKMMFYINNCLFEKNLKFLTSKSCNLVGPEATSNITFLRIFFSHEPLGASVINAINGMSSKIKRKISIFGKAWCLHQNHVITLDFF